MNLLRYVIIILLMAGCKSKQQSKPEPGPVTNISEDNTAPSYPGVSYHKILFFSLDSTVTTVSLYNMGLGDEFFKEDNSPAVSAYSARELDSTEKKQLSLFFRRIEEKGNPEMMAVTACAPVYRDVLVYYDSLNKPIARVSMCFGCGKIKFRPADAIVDTRFYDLNDEDVIKRWKDLEKLLLKRE